MHSSSTVYTLLAALPATLACLAQGGIPEATDHISLTEPTYIAPGEVFDAQFVRYDRGPGACNEQVEGGEADTVFVLEEGATIRNVIM